MIDFKIIWKINEGMKCFFHPDSLPFVVLFYDLKRDGFTWEKHALRSLSIRSSVIVRQEFITKHLHLFFTYFLIRTTSPDFKLYSTSTAWSTWTDGTAKARQFSSIKRESPFHLSKLAMRFGFFIRLSCVVHAEKTMPIYTKNKPISDDCSSSIEKWVTDWFMQKR